MTYVIHVLQNLPAPADDSMMNKANSHGFRFLQKPFSLSARLEAMDEL
jgi:hypothetical protein